MTKYACIELIGNTCVRWEPIANESIIESLAITSEQADQLTIACLLVIFTAWVIRQALNVLLKRRY